MTDLSPKENPVSVKKPGSAQGKTGLCNRRSLRVAHGHDDCVPHTLVGVVLHESDDREVFELDGRQRGGETGLLLEPFKIAFQPFADVGQIHCHFGLATAVGELFPVGSAGERAYDVVVESELVAADVTD